MPIDMELTIYDPEHPHDVWKVQESGDCPECVDLYRLDDNREMQGHQFWTEAQAREVAEAILRVCDDIKRKREANDAH